MDYAPFRAIAQHACTAVLARKFSRPDPRSGKIVASMKNFSTDKTYCCHCPVQSNTILPTPITSLKALTIKF